MLVSKGWLQSEITVRHYNGKNKQGERDGGGLRIWHFLSINLMSESFCGVAHSVLISLGHLELHFWLCQSQTRKITAV